MRSSTATAAGLQACCHVLVCPQSAPLPPLHTTDAAHHCDDHAGKGVAAGDVRWGDLWMGQQACHAHN